MKDWICSQLGAREHYAIPRALQGENRLARVLTDLRRPGLNAMDPKLVSTFPLGGLKWWWKLRAAGHSHDGFIANGSWFSNAVARKLESEDVAGKIFFGYDTGFLEAARALKQRGATCVVGQIDPGRTEFDLVAEERKLWPRWEDESYTIPEAYHARREAEWETADQIIVNSNWSHSALLQQGVPEEKLRIIPLCYEPSLPLQDAPQEKKAPLRVLWLGQVNLRKGIPYLLKAAESLQREAIQFTVAGPIQISSDQVSKAPPNVRFVGRVSRDEASSFYREADVFVLPTISDGFAITQLEAMAHGLPVIATPNAGEVVENGVNGYVVPIRDARALGERIRKFAEDTEKLSQFSSEALRRSGEFSLDRLAQDLLSLEK